MKHNRDWNKVSLFEIFTHGIIMGTINKLPGISGGLYSLIIGFYNHLISSIKSISYKNLKILKTDGVKPFLRLINGNFLFFISTGMIMSYFTTSKILDYFLIKNELYVWAVFFGLILGSLYILIKRIKKTNINTAIFLFFGLLFGIFISVSDPLYENRNLLFIFFCGFISICGITIPGLSGSFLLILLGNYKLLLVDSVNNFFNLISNFFYTSEQKLNVENVLLLNSNHRLGHKKLGPYDLIISLEPLGFIEDTLLNQLSEGGKLFYCEKQNVNLNESKLNVYYKEGTRYTKKQLFDLEI